MPARGRLAASWLGVQQSALPSRRHAAVGKPLSFPADERESRNVALPEESRLRWKVGPLQIELATGRGSDRTAWISIRRAIAGLPRPEDPYDEPAHRWNGPSPACNGSPQGENRAFSADPSRCLPAKNRRCLTTSRRRDAMDLLIAATRRVQGIPDVSPRRRALGRKQRAGVSRQRPVVSLFCPIVSMRQGVVPINRPFSRWHEPLQ